MTRKKQKKSSVAIILPLLLIAGVVIFNLTKSQSLYPQAQLIGSKTSFNGKEPIKYNLQLKKRSTAAVLLQKVSVFAQEETTNNIQNTEYKDPIKTINVELTNKSTDLKANLPVTIEKTSNYNYEITVYPNGNTFRPSEYELAVNIKKGNQIKKLSKHFVWGVLALNTDKGTYIKNEDVYIQMAALDEEGHTRCNADLKLKVTDPSGKTQELSTQGGSIDTSGECGEDNVTYTPDFYLYYRPEQNGEYHLELTDISNEYSITDTFNVANSSSFEIKRKSATRINPFKSEYKMQIFAKSNEKRSGYFVEIVPSTFKIENNNNYVIKQRGQVKEIIWKVDLEANEELELAYTYQAPKVSPELFLAGPLEFRNNFGTIFKDSNIWQIASDDTENTFRITTYQLMNDSSGFSGTTYTLTLNNNLENNYFVHIENAGGSTTSSTETGPDEGYARVTGDPHSNFSTVTSDDQIQLTRGGSTGNWQGAITVIECLGDEETSGFELLDVVEIALSGTTTTNTGTSGTAWSDIDQVGVYGGDHGGGSHTTEDASAGWQSVWAKVWPSSTTTINVERDFTNNGGEGDTATFTNYVVEWGSEWTIQRVSMEDSSANGGDGVDTTGEYYTDTITSVTRDDTFVIGSILKGDNGLSDGADGSVLTLGDGVNTNSSETTVAIGSETAGDNLEAEVYVHTHTDASVNYYFGADDSTPGIPDLGSTGTHTVASVSGESYDNSSTDVQYTEGERFSVFYNTCNGTGTAFPRPVIGSRPTAATTISWFRSRNDQPGAYWMQSVDLGSITYESGATLSGVAYTDEGSTPLDGSSTNKTVNLRVNGSGTYTDEITTSDGAWNISGITLSANDIVTVYLDGETEKATTVMISDGTEKTNINLYQNTVIVRADTGNITNANLSTGDDADADVLYNVSTNNLTVDSGTELHVWTGDTYDPGGTITTNSTGGDFHIDDSATAYIDTATSTIGLDIQVDTGATLYIDANTTVTGGDITTAGTGNVTTSTGTPTVTVNGTGTLGGGSQTMTFYNLSTSGTGTITTNATLSISNDLTVGDSTNASTLEVNTNDNAVTVGHDFTISNNGTYSASSNTSNPLNISEDFNNNGTFTNNSGEVIFSSSNTSQISGATTWNNLKSTVAGKTIEFENGVTQTVNGVLTLSGTGVSDIVIQSQNNGNQWTINQQGTESVNYASVKDSGCDGGSTDVTVTNGTDVSNNSSCWTFVTVVHSTNFEGGINLEGVNIN